MEGHEFVRAAEALRPWLVATRRRLHERPELGNDLDATRAEVEARLAEIGVEAKRLGPAIVGLVRGALPGPTVALRADMDALPVTEAEGRPYRSRNEGAMHACGHDAHTAILLGAARLLAGARAGLAGNVKLLFQPDEEGEGGAEPMIRAGCLEDPRVDRVAGLHVMPYLEVGRVELRKGALNGSSTKLSITVRGRSAHGAYPELGVDAVHIAAAVVQALHSLVSRTVSPLEQAVLTIGTIHGGKVANILAEEVAMEATMRTTDDGIRDGLVERVRAVVEGVSAALGGSGELRVRYGYAALVNDADTVDSVAEVAAGLLGPGSVAWKERPSMGVEDFSFFLKERKGAFYHLGCGAAARGVSAPLHSADFDIDEGCLVTGTAMQAALALRLVEDARKEWKA